ncbi:hypothetical protein NZL82_14045 [Sphingomonas sanguinis]|uniref:hypothetical protein n=1 Tax=Sphingomonas sp. LC-1 TaxID=3110957 RepID=UPI0021BBA537|nr:hypothetical protein [Sphingomonas sp. LC-1]MCT8002998.1 hypothetical protein [Sphingomonas sp. LC-1]
MKDWQHYGIGVFAVAAGQWLRIGQKIEAKQPVTWRDIAVLISLLPAFGALGGAAAQHFGWPLWAYLTVAISSGWLGFGAMKFVLGAAKTILGTIAGIASQKDKPEA